MASRSAWQPNYRDLSDDRTISFGAECYVCHARYVSSPEPMVAPLPVDGEPDPQLARAIEQQKQELFGEFDSAFRSITIICFRCGNPACPDCWDVDKQMCGACVAERGLIRSPHRGEPAEGPLASGYLRRAEPGQYSEIARPTWLKDLLAAQSDPEAAQRVHLTAPPPISGRPARPDELPDLGSVSYPRVPPLEHDRPVFEQPPTRKMDAYAERPAPGPSTPDSLGGLEGEATSGTVQCPRCHTTNYDFVTQCSGCGLQLIQICPNCDRLNPGHAEQCQQCGAPLTRPAGWSGVHQQVQPVDPGEARRRATAGPAPMGGMGGMGGMAGPTPIAPAWQPSRRPTPQAAPGWGLDDPSGSQHGWPGSERELGRSERGWRRANPPPPAPYAEQAMPEMLEMATVGADLAGPLLTAPHPYETMGPALQPVLSQDRREARGPRGAQVLLALGALIERLFTIALLIALFAIVGLITAAESSTSANAALTAYLHYDIKAHLDALLTLLHIHLQK